MNLAIFCELDSQFIARTCRYGAVGILQISWSPWWFLSVSNVTLGDPLSEAWVSHVVPAIKLGGMCFDPELLKLFVVVFFLRLELLKKIIDWTRGV